MRLATLVGLLSGLLVGALALGAVALSLGSATVEPPPGGAALVTATATPIPSPTAVSSPTASATSGPTSGPTSSGPVSGGPAAGLKVGQLAPGLTLPQVSGGKLDLAALRGKPVWLAFTASWCPSCRDEMSLMDAANAQYGDRLVIVAVDVKEDAATAAALVAQTGFVARMAVDRDGTGQASFGAFVLPIHYFIDKDGVIRDVLYGEASVPEFAAGIRSVLPGAASFTP